MFKKIILGAFIALTFTMAQAQTPVAGARAERTPIRLEQGRLYVNGELVYKNFSLTQGRFTYLFFYVPGRGLFTVSNREFAGASQAGAFEGATLSFGVANIDVALKSASQILGEESSPAWVRFDPDFKLDVKAVMFGYGNKERAPYDWPDQIRKNRR